MAFSGTLLRTMHSEPEHTGATSTQGGCSASSTAWRQPDRTVQEGPMAGFLLLPPPAILCKSLQGRV